MSDTIHDDDAPSPADSEIQTGLAEAPGVLKVYQTGDVTVVGFGGNDVPDEVCITGYRDQLMRLIEAHHTKVLAFDLSGVKLVPSGMLGVLVTLRKRVERLELYNPSDDVRSVLAITGLEKLFDIRQVEV